VIGQTLYIGSDKGICFALDTATGKTRWTYQDQHVVKASPSYDGGMVYFADYHGGMFALRASGGHKVWSTFTPDLPPGGGGGFYSSPAITNGLVYAGRDDGTVYALDKRDGHYSWSFDTDNFTVRLTRGGQRPGHEGLDRLHRVLRPPPLRDRRPETASCAGATTSGGRFPAPRS